MKIKQTVRNIVYGTLVGGTALLTAYLGSGCGGVGSAPAADTRTVFVQKTEAKFSSTYNTRNYATATPIIMVAPIAGSATSTEFASLTAANGNILDIYLFDRSATGTLSTFETQLCVLVDPNVAAVCVAAGESLEAKIDTKYSGM